MDDNELEQPNGDSEETAEVLTDDEAAEDTTDEVVENGEEDEPYLGENGPQGGNR